MVPSGNRTHSFLASHRFPPRNLCPGLKTLRLGRSLFFLPLLIIYVLMMLMPAVGPMTHYLAHSLAHFRLSIVQQISDSPSYSGHEGAEVPHHSHHPHHGHSHSLLVTALLKAVPAMNSDHLMDRDYHRTKVATRLLLGSVGVTASTLGTSHSRFQPYLIQLHKLHPQTPPTPPPRVA